ncbi:MAG: YDG domain-containing protein [Limisphaerales bacterium]
MKTSCDTPSSKPVQKFIRLWACLFLFLLAGSEARAQMEIYSNALVNGWENYSYNSTIVLNNTLPVYNGCSDSVSVTITSAYGAFVPYIAPMSDTAYSSISFWLNGGTSGGQHLQLYGNEGTGPTPQSPRVSLGTIAANTWSNYTVTLSALGVSNVSNFSGFAIQDSAGTSEPTFYLDNIVLNAAAALTASAGSNVTNCAGGSATIGGNPTASGGAGGYTYSWSPTNGLSNSTVANPIASPASTTTYTVTVTDSSENTAHASVTVTVSPNEAPTVSTGGNQTITAGNSTAGLGGVVGGGATGGVWTTSGSGTFSPGTTTLNATYAPSASDISAGTVTLTLTTTGQLSPCSAASAEVVVTIISTQWIYSNALVNSWGNSSYGTTVNYANTSPVYPGDTDSISATITGAYDGIGFYHAAMSDSNYASISFLVNGGASGGQSLQMYATTSSSNGSTYALTAPLANTWQQYWVPLSALGVSNVANFTGFVIQDYAGTSEPTFYLDNIQLTSYKAPPLTPIAVNASQSIRAADARWFGLNTAVWDSYLDTSDTVTLLNNMGTQALRYPGGSDSDNFQWVTNGLNGGGYVAPEATLQSFVQVMTNINAKAMMTLNYGTGSTNEAGAWVAYCNAATNSTVALGTDGYDYNWQTAGYWASLRAAAPLHTDDGKNYLRISHPTPLGFKYWEIGNEVYGASWETDTNNVPHDPYTYALRAQGFISLIHAVDSTSKVGVVVENGEDNYANNEDHLVTNPVTRGTHYGWTPVLLTYLKVFGNMPDFAIFHNYPYNPGNESDSGLLQSSEPPTGWAYYASDLRTQITDYLGANLGTNIELVCTENNSVSSSPGKQSVSLVNGLYKLDSLAQLMQTEFNGLFWWDLRNGQGTGGNNSGTLYGWREYGDYGVVNEDSDTGETDLYPTYYTTDLMTNFVQTGDTVVTASSTYGLLSSYAVQRQNGHLTVLVINKDPSNTLTGQVTLAGFSPGSSAAVYSYGIPQDDAVEFGSGSPGPAQTTISVSGTNITYAFAPYSATVFSFSASSLAASAGNPETICAGGNTSIGGSPTASGGAGGYTYAWSPATGLSSTNVANPSASPTTTTTYTVTVTDSSLNTAHASVTVTVNPAATAGTGGNQSICAGSSTAGLGGVVGGGAMGGFWTTSGSGTFSPNTNTLNATYNPSGADITAGTVTLTLTTTGQLSPCGASTAPVVVTIHALPTITLGASPSLTYHSSTSANLPYTATSGSPNEYSVTYGSTAQTAGFANVGLTALPSSPIHLTVPITAGVNTYGGTLALNNSSTGCGSTNYPFTVTVNPLPVALTGTRAYDGTETAAAGILSVANAVAGDNVYPASGSATLAGASVGTETITSAGTLLLGGTSAGNYALAGFSGSVTVTNPFVPFTITSSSLDVTGTNFVVCWQSIPGVSYKVLTNTSLAAPQTWSLAGGPITASNTTTCFTLPGGITGKTNVNVVIQQ